MRGRAKSILTTLQFKYRFWQKQRVLKNDKPHISALKTENYSQNYVFRNTHILFNHNNPYWNSCFSVQNLSPIKIIIKI